MSRVSQRILAFLSRNEILAQAQGLMAMTLSEKAKFWQDYAAARALIPQLAALPTQPLSIAALPATALPYVQQLEASEPFQEAFGGLVYEFGEVPLDRLIPVQTFVHADRLPPPPRDDYDALLRYCLPSEPLVPGSISPTAWGIRFRTRRYGMGPAHLQRRIQNDHVVLSFEHVNLFHVQRFADHLILSNGTHRACELIAAGFTSAPAVIVQRRSVEEVEHLEGVGKWNPAFIFAQPRPPQWGLRPPLITDFATPLAVEGRVLLDESVVDVTIGPSTNLKVHFG